LGDKKAIESLRFTGHALRQMFARSVSVDEVKAVVENGEIIATYPDDRPYPSDLLLGLGLSKRPLHVVLAYNEDIRTAYVITAYVPDLTIWSDDYKSRREQ
jgi:hypothetical protein